MASSPTPTYVAVNPASWKLGNVSTSPKGLKKVEILTADGGKPVFQLWKPSDPFLRAPYGISEPFCDGVPPTSSNGVGTPQTNTNVSVKTMPLELKHGPHLEFAQHIDTVLLGLIHANQIKLLDLHPDDEMLPISMLRRQFCGFVKPSKKPEYPATARVKVNVGSSELATHFSKLQSNKQLIPCASDNMMRNCTVIPIIEVGSLWLNSTGGYGVTAQASQILIMSSGAVNTPSFSGLEFAINMEV